MLNEFFSLCRHVKDLVILTSGCQVLACVSLYFWFLWLLVRIVLNTIFPTGSNQHYYVFVGSWTSILVIMGQFPRSVLHAESAGSTRNERQETEEDGKANEKAAEPSVEEFEFCGFTNSSAYVRWSSYNEFTCYRSSYCRTRR